MSVLQLGDKVRFTGTVVKDPAYWGKIRYKDAEAPGFHGWNWSKNNDITFYPIHEGYVVGKRRYVSMENDEGIWVSDGAQSFTAYLVAYHLSRKPVMVRLDQMVPLERLKTMKGAGK